MSRTHLQIGELAKLFNVTTHALRYYEKEGLLTPAQITDKGYRLYDFSAIGQLEEILVLRSLDMSIETIKTYYEQKNASNYRQQLSELEQIIDKKINALNQLKKTVQHNKELATDYLAKGHNFKIKHFKKRYLLYIKTLINPFSFDFDEKEFYHLIEKVTGFVPLNYSKDLVFLSKGLKTELYLEINALDVATVLEHTDDFVTLPEGSYLCAFHRSTSLPQYLTFMDKVSDYLKTNNLTATDTMLDIASSDYHVFSDDNELTYFQLHLQQ